MCVCVCVCVRQRDRESCSVVLDTVTPWTVAQARILEWVALPFSRGYS